MGIFSIAILASVTALAADTSVEQSKWGMSVAFVKCEKYSAMDEKRFLTVYSSKFEDFRTAESSAEHSAWLEPGKELAGPEGSRIFFHEYAPEPASKGTPATVLDDRAGGRLISFWSDTEFKTVSKVIAVWRKSTGTPTLETILNLAMLTDYGTAKFTEIYHVGNKRHIIIGRSSGGDGGTVWGSVWVGLWTEPRKFEIIEEAKYEGDEQVARTLEYVFDPKKLSILYRQLSRRPKSNSADEGPSRIDRVWTVDLKEKINALSGRRPMRNRGLIAAAAQLWRSADKAIGQADRGHQ